MTEPQQLENIHPFESIIKCSDRYVLNGHRSALLWFTGLSGSGKSTLAHAVEARLFKLGDTYHMDGTLDADLELACGRCLEAFAYRDHIGIRHSLQPEGRELGPDAFAYAEESFDLEAMVRELVDLNLPMKPLCTEACKGLCPSCGANWNRGACDCRPEPGGPLAEALRKLTKGE